MITNALQVIHYGSFFFVYAILFIKTILALVVFKMSLKKLKIIVEY